jgi:hypothetical protein
LYATRERCQYGMRTTVSRAHLLYSVELEFEFVSAILGVLQRDLQFVRSVVTLNLLLQLADPLLMLIGSGLYFLELGFPELDFALLHAHEDRPGMKSEVPHKPGL